MKTATPRRAAGASSRSDARVSTTVTRPWRGVRERADDFAYPLVAIIAVAIVFVGQLVEDLGDSPGLQMLPPEPVIQRWAVVVLVAWALVMWAMLDRTVKRSLPAVRRVVKIDQEAFTMYERALRRPPALVDAAILAGTILINIVLFVFLNADLLLDDPVTEQGTKLPSNPVAATLIIAAYTVVGWAFLRLIYLGARLARQLGKLSREPLDINVFDTSDLLPFGNMALALTFAPAGALVIALVGLGAPTTPVGWSVVAEATLVIVLVLLLPLRGIHSQMSAAKDAALGTINARLTEVYRTASGPIPTQPEEAALLGGATGALVPLRKTIQEMTTWPFRDTVALGRAVLIASAPIIYYTLNELIGKFIIGRVP